MVAQGSHIVAHGPQGLQLRGLGGIDGLEQGTHGEVAPVHRDGVGVLHPLPLQQGSQPGIAAVLSPVLRGGRVEMVVGIVGKQDHRVMTALRRPPGRAGKDQQRKGKNGQNKPFQAQTHHNSPSLSPILP